MSESGHGPTPTDKMNPAEPPPHIRGRSVTDLTPEKVGALIAADAKNTRPWVRTRLIAAAPELARALLDAWEHHAGTQRALATAGMEHRAALKTNKELRAENRECKDARHLLGQNNDALRAEWQRLRAETGRLQRWKEEATIVIEQWEKIHDALGKPAGLGESRADASVRGVERLWAAIDEAQLRYIEASNPGIDMDKVRISRTRKLEPT